MSARAPPGPRVGPANDRAKAADADARLVRGVRMGDVDRARSRLEAERAETRERLAHLIEDYDAMVAASRGSNADDEHDPEGATIAFERSQVGALVRQARLHAVEIDAAVGRLESGGYGTCERCGGAIGAGRLAVRPVARTCIQCATATSG
ncbi:MAG TPA: TraR/DksA C4-type zinc finger protein [Nocardioides sp.]|nr:TraR/DksA C4-type zinc finger protein [Nocardioides sp.]